MLRRTLLPLCACALLASFQGCLGSRWLSVPSYPQTPGQAGRFCVVGDLQRTSWLELWREQNDAERQALIAALAARSPDFVIGLGDLVFDAGSLSAWQHLDRLLAPLRAAGIPLIPVLGNHEYWGDDALARHERARRFPQTADSGWLCLRQGPLAVLLLDSNQEALAEETWQRQRAWFTASLAALDADPTVRGVLVCLHHPPFTNSTVTGDEEHVIADLLPAFLGAAKTLAMLSGHVHSYERFEVQRRCLLVSGGGGGPRAALLPVAQRRHPDLYDGPRLRAFHFIELTVKDAGLDLLVLGIEKGRSELFLMERFSLPWPAGG